MTRSAAPRLAAAICGLLLAASALSSCVSPARDDASYRAKAHQSAKAATSEVAAVQMVLDLLNRNRISSAYADEVISSSEDALTSISSSFGSVQPPHTDDADAISNQANDALTAGSDAVRDARIAARRSDAEALSDAAQELQDAAAALDQLERGSR